MYLHIDCFYLRLVSFRLQAYNTSVGMKRKVSTLLCCSYQIETIGLSPAPNSPAKAKRRARAAPSLRRRTAALPCGSRGPARGFGGMVPASRGAACPFRRPSLGPFCPPRARAKRDCAAPGPGFRPGSLAPRAGRRPACRAVCGPLACPRGQAGPLTPWAQYGKIRNKVSNRNHRKRDALCRNRT